MIAKQFHKRGIHFFIKSKSILPFNDQLLNHSLDWGNKREEMSIVWIVCLKEIVISIISPFPLILFI